MSKTQRSKDFVRFIKEQTVPQDDFRTAFEYETEKLAVSRFRLCVSILLLLTFLSMGADLWLSVPVFLSVPFQLRFVVAGILLFFGLLSFVPQFRKNCYAFTILLALFIGTSTALIQVYQEPTAIDQMAIYTLFFIMVGFLMPWGATASAGVCLPLYLFYPLGIYLSPNALDKDLFIRSNVYLGLYSVLALLAAHMNERMRYQ